MAVNQQQIYSELARRQVPMVEGEEDRRKALAKIMASLGGGAGGYGPVHHPAAGALMAGADMLGGYLQGKGMRDEAAAEEAERAALVEAIQSFGGGGDMGAEISGGAGADSAIGYAGPDMLGGDVSGGDGPYDVGAASAYVQDAAARRGIDPDVALRVARSEGLAPGVWQSNVVKNGKRETSYGPFQLLVGGGLGDKFKKVYGKSPEDPSTWRQQIDFALDEAAKGGWSPWYGAAKVGVGRRTGLENARALGPQQEAYPQVANMGSGRDRVAAAMQQQGGGGLVQRVKDKYKGLAPYDFRVKDSRAQGISNGRKLESYPADERDNPYPGQHTVELFDPSFQGEQAVDMVAADFIHFLGKNDPTVMKLREQFKESLTPEQMEVDRRAYERAQAEGDQRSFEDWSDVHRLDQYLGAAFLPEGSANRADWLGGMTSEQRGILDNIQNFMRTGEARSDRTGGNIRAVDRVAQALQATQPGFGRDPEAFARGREATQAYPVLPEQRPEERISPRLPGDVVPFVPGRQPDPLAPTAPDPLAPVMADQIPPVAADPLAPVAVMADRLAPAQPDARLVGREPGGITIQPPGAPGPRQFDQAAQAMAVPTPLQFQPAQSFTGPVPQAAPQPAPMAPAVQRVAQALTPGQTRAFQPEEADSALVPSLRPTPTMPGMRNMPPMQSTGLVNTDNPIARVAGAILSGGGQRPGLPPQMAAQGAPQPGMGAPMAPGGAQQAPMGAGGPGGLDLSVLPNKALVQIYKELATDDIKRNTPEGQLAFQSAQAELQRRQLEIQKTQRDLDTPQGSLSPGEQWVEGPDGQMRAQTIPGSKLEQEQQAAAAAAEAAEAEQRAQTTQKGNIVITDIGRARKKIEGASWYSPAAGFLGDWLKHVGGTSAADTSKLLDTVRANIGFDRLQAMREASPTGGALGQVTVREIELLQAVMGNLEQSQSEEQLLENLDRLDEIYAGVLKKAGAYPNAADFGFGDKPSEGEKKRFRYNPETGELE